MKKKLTLIIMINLIGIIMGCSTVTIGATIANKSIEKDKLQTIKETGVITIASAYGIPFFNINPETNKISGIDAGISDSVVVNYLLLKDQNLLLRTLKDYTPEIPGAIGIAVRKDQTSLLNALNKIINDMKADGTLYAILVENGLDKNNMI